MATTVPTSPDAPEPIPRILIVDDHELLAGTLALALRQEGIEVSVPPASSPAAILDAARSLAPVLVLLDLDLGPPLGDGHGLVRPLLEAGAQVLVVTGVTDQGRLGACIEAGACGVVSKGAGFEGLVEAVRRAAAGERVMPEERRQTLLAAARARRRDEAARLAPFLALSRREQAVLAGLVAGQSAEVIAERAYVSLATVRSQIRAILLKLGVNSQLAAVALARDAGWPPDD